MCEFSNVLCLILISISGSAKYSEGSLNKACELQASMQANFGGTEILRPLEDIYSRPLIDGYPRQVNTSHIDIGLQL